jgi:ATP-dependent DNA helicase RecG
MAKKELEVKKLIKKGESQTLEFKSSLSDVDKILHDLCGFANTDGGILLVGVKDSGRILGADIGKNTLESFTNKISQGFDPKLYPKIEKERLDNKDLLLVEVKDSTNKPYQVFGKAFKRVGKSTVQMSRDEFERIILEKHREKIQFDSQICRDVKVKDVDERKVRLFLEKAKRERRLELDPKIPVREVLEKLDLMKNGKLTNTAILMFGRNPQKFFLQTEVRCAKFKGVKPVKPFLDMKVIRETIHEQIDEAERFVLSNIRKEAWTVSGQVEREERWEYPPDAIREAITNAVAHRDYFSTANVHVSIFDDRIEVWNPGKLPEPLTPEDLKKEHKSIPVNRLLAHMLFLVKDIERWGTGTNDIVKECIDHGLPEPIFKYQAGGFAVILRKSKIPEDLDELGLNERQKKAVEYISQHGKITSGEFQSLYAGVTRETLRKDLNDLITKKVIVRKGVKKGAVYEFT